MTWSRERSVVPLALLASVTLACGEAKKPPRIDSISTQAATPVPTIVPATPPSDRSSAASAAPSGETNVVSPGASPDGDIPKFGVPDCDNYVRKYLECEARVGPGDREKLQAALEADVAKWRQLITMKEGRLAAGLACKTAHSAAKEKLDVDYGCDF